MPAALDRLLASPSALRVLRAFVTNPDVPAICSVNARCCFSTISRLHNTSKHVVQVPENPQEPPTTDTKQERSLVRRVSSVPALHKELWLRIEKAKGQETVEELAKAVSRIDRIYGHHGIRRFLQEMTERGYQLPTDDSFEAEIIWDTVLKHQDLVFKVLDHATHVFRITGQVYSQLYLKCMIHWLPRRSTLALDIHHQLLVSLRLRKLPLRQILQETRHDSQALKALMMIYRTSNERDIYDEVVPFLCDRKHFDTAHRWHTMCLHRGDRPSELTAVHPVVQLFLAEFSTNSIYGIGNNTTVKFKANQNSTDARLGNLRYDQDLLRRLVGRRTAPVRFDDPFCARLFATRAFPPASIISGLTMVGINEIGPQALRMLGLRAESLSELPVRFMELKEAGIALKGCVYSLALEKFAMEGRFRLVKSILDSDQHPDVFDDESVQKKLLEYYLERKDWTQAYRTLAILALFHNDPNTESWNLMLQARISQRNAPEIVQVLQDMNLNKVAVSNESLNTVRSILRPRSPGKRPRTMRRPPFDDLRFVTKLFIMIMESGNIVIAPRRWTEILRRFGMLLRLRELRRLTLWLLSWYGPRNPRFSMLPRSAHPQQDFRNIRSSLPLDHPSHPIQQLFPKSFQQGLIVWGFRAGLLPHAPLEQHLFSGNAAKEQYRRRFLRKGILERTEWSSGLRMLVALRDRGVPVHVDTVVKALQTQFVVLFGHGRSNMVASRMIRRTNSKDYDEYVREVNDIWGEPLFCETHRLDASTEPRLSWHPMLSREDSWHLFLSLGRTWAPHELTQENPEELERQDVLLDAQNRPNTKTSEDMAESDDTP